MSSCETRRPDVCGLMRIVRAWREVTGAETKTASDAVSMEYLIPLYSSILQSATMYSFCSAEAKSDGGGAGLDFSPEDQQPHKDS